MVVLSLPCAATAQADFATIDAFLKGTLKGEDQLTFQAKGDLNGDGLEDWAGVIERQQTDSPRTDQLYVLLQIRGGGYRIAEKSKQEEVSGTGCCYVEDLEIRGASIYIQDNIKTDDAMNAVTHQFKLYKGKWRLVGVKIYRTDFNPTVPASIDTDMNLLTGSVTEKRQKGDDKPVSRSRRKKFGVYLLKDFDFSNKFGNQ
jgi:hypothetical protein